MTAFDEVLQAEKAADKDVSEAKEQAGVAVQNARTAQQERLQQEETKLANDAQEAAAKEEARVSELAKEISAEVQNQVAAVEQRFHSKREEMKKTVKQRFQ